MTTQFEWNYKKDLRKSTSKSGTVCSPTFKVNFDGEVYFWKIVIDSSKQFYLMSEKIQRVVFVRLKRFQNNNEKLHFAWLIDKYFINNDNDKVCIEVCVLRNDCFTPHIVWSIVALAHKCDISTLKCICRKTLENELSVESLILADKYKLVESKIRFRQFIKHKIQERLERPANL